MQGSLQSARPWPLPQAWPSAGGPACAPQALNQPLPCCRLPHAPLDVSACAPRTLLPTLLPQRPARWARRQALRHLARRAPEVQTGCCWLQPQRLGHRRQMRLGCCALRPPPAPRPLRPPGEPPAQRWTAARASSSSAPAAARRARPPPHLPVRPARLGVSNSIQACYVQCTRATTERLHSQGNLHAKQKRHAQRQALHLVNGTSYLPFCTLKGIGSAYPLRHQPCREL